MQVRSVGRARYFITFIDDFSRKSFVYFLKSKDEALKKFKEFVAFVERKTSTKVKCLRTDNGKEYLNDSFAEFLKDNGIRHERSVPDTPQQNGIAERLNRTLVEKARTMLIDAGLSLDLWAEAVGTANYLRNRCPTKALRDMTPQEAWSGRKPNLAHLKIFGCLAMVHIPDRRRRKWDAKSEERIFVGYSETSKGYRTINRITKKLTVAKDVVFLETKFPAIQESMGQEHFFLKKMETF
uniref:Integrase catalytic domain-containing protein n=1 Tax=Trichuris muris TaxID=70415 RepID=A0A5S6QGT0_TRIMR